MNLIRSQRREWDSNPRALADKRFSRPPRYDHFDTSPVLFCLVHFPNAKMILAKIITSVNIFFHIFLFYFFFSNFLYFYCILRPDTPKKIKHIRFYTFQRNQRSSLLLTNFSQTPLQFSYLPVL